MFRIATLYIYSFGQLPRECTLDKEVFDFECCPNTTFGICGGSERETCEDIRGTITDPCQSSSNDVKEQKYCRVQEFLQSRPGTGNTDFRYRWPTQIFERVCVCKENYDDYNCMRCKRGYTGDDSSQPSTPVVRRNILSLSQAEQNRTLENFQMIKSVKASGYTVPIREPVSNVPQEFLLRLLCMTSLYHFILILSEMSQ